MLNKKKPKNKEKSLRSAGMQGKTVSQYSYTDEEKNKKATGPL